jgi:hypothetical protein
MPELRTPEQILKDWREAEALLPADGSTPDPDLLSRIGYHRAEHQIAMANRAAQAAELGRTPRIPDEPTPA